MNKKIVAILAVLWMCATTSSLRGEFETIAGWDEQVFPSYLISTAAMKHTTEVDETTLGDALGAFGVVVTATEDDQPIKVSILCDGFAETSEFVGVLPKEGQAYRVFPKMRYKFEKLSQYRQATPSSVTFRVQLGEDVPEEKTVTITMRSINDCAFTLIDGDNTIDMNFCFAAYVNEQHPFVDKLLREALDIGVIDSFNGYQSNDPNQVIAQVYAIWDLMANRDVRYSSITATAALSRNTHSQHVRLLEETINNTQANCVDGTVLFASVLRKIGIDSALVVTKDHCYLAFWAGKNHEKLYGLETTMMCADTSEEEIPDFYDAAVAEEQRWDYSWGSFVLAMATGTTNLQKELDKKEAEISIIDVATARLNGVLPIPFHSDQEFLAYDFTYSEDEVAEEAGEAMEETEYGEETEEMVAADEGSAATTEEWNTEETEAIASEQESVEWDEEETPKKRRRAPKQPAANVEWE